MPEVNVYPEAVMITTDTLSPYITFDANDTGTISLLENLIAQAYAYLQKYLGYNPAATAYTERQSSDSVLYTLILKEFPVTELTSVKVNGSLYPGTTELNASAGLVELDYGIQPGRLHIQIEYTAGFTSYPADLEGALIEYICWSYMRIRSEGYGVKSKITGDMTTTLETNVPWNVRAVFDRYKK